MAHLQRSLPGDGYAPDLGWDIHVESVHPNLPCRMVEGSSAPVTVGTETLTHSFVTETPSALLLEGGGYRLYHPAAPFKRRGRIEAQRAADG